MKDVIIYKENLKYLNKVKDLSKIKSLKDLKDKIGYDYTDIRTKFIDGVPHVYPVGGFGKQVYICCPYCKKFHSHGRVEGHRVAHCMDEEAREISGNGYYIMGMSEKSN